MCSHISILADGTKTRSVAEVGLRKRKEFAEHFVLKCGIFNPQVNFAAVNIIGLKKFFFKFYHNKHKIYFMCILIHNH